ncbi:MAG: hypothetical protein WB443_05290, partial [Nitrososphaeraceae archaeon]
EVDDYQISTVDHPVSSSSHNEGLLPFEFSLLVQDVQSFVKSTITKNGCGSTDFLTKAQGK